MTDIIFYCKKNKTDTDCVTWSPKQIEITQWIDQFPGLDVRGQLASLASWTDRYRSKVKLRKNMGKWVTDRLRASYQPVHDSQRRQAAFNELSKPEHERRGMSQQEYDRQMAEQHAESLQASLPISGPFKTIPPKAARELDELKSLLAADLRRLEETRPRVLPAIAPAHCEHEGWNIEQQNNCPVCGMFKHQFEVNNAFYIEQAREAFLTPLQAYSQ
ncbi:MAG: hypothetical protein AAF438_06820 [Pseudomonadota bacterium]